ncbi:MAG: HAD-IA family hydrolase [Haloarculaceae archaeon]
MDGRVASGKNHSEQFMPLVADIVVEELGFHPYPGTLNLHGVDGIDRLPERVVEDSSLGFDNCRGVTLRPCSVAGVRAGIINPLVDNYPPDKTEIIAPVALRQLFTIADGDSLTVSTTDELASPDGPEVVAEALDEFAAVVFDLDHTLVELAVEWEDVKDELTELLGEFLDKPLHQDMDVSLSEVARTNNRYEEFAATVAEYELDGAEKATKLPLLDVVDQLDCSVGICTRNAERAAERALVRFGVADSVDAVVARETVPEQKPDPKPLEHCLELLDVSPGDAAFVGDDPTDLEAAVAAGTSFFYPERFDVT